MTTMCGDENMAPDKGQYDAESEGLNFLLTSLWGDPKKLSCWPGRRFHFSVLRSVLNRWVRDSFHVHFVRFWQACLARCFSLHPTPLQPVHSFFYFVFVHINLPRLRSCFLSLSLAQRYKSKRGHLGFYLICFCFSNIHSWNLCVFILCEKGM